MRKVILSIIITMSLILTSGIHSFTPQERLERTLESLNSTQLKIKITEWYPKSAGEQNHAQPTKPVGELNAGWQVVNRESGTEPKSLVIKTFSTAGTGNLLDNYDRIREEALAFSGDARLEISAEIPGDISQLRQIGHRLLNSLGADEIVQEVEDISTPGELAANQGWLMYSGASLIKGWGDPITAGNDRLNVVVLLRPSDDGTGVKLSIYAPVIQS